MFGGNCLENVSSLAVNSVTLIRLLNQFQAPNNDPEGFIVTCAGELFPKFTYVLFACFQIFYEISVPDYCIITVETLGTLQREGSIIL